MEGGVKGYGVTPRVLAVLASSEDCAMLRRTLSNGGWELISAGSFREAQIALRTGSSIGVVVSDARLCDGSCWKDLLRELQNVHQPTQLIVADRLADEALSAEVLNLGGYDLLMMPFVEAEVLRVIPMAWEFQARQSAERASALRKLPPDTTEELGRTNSPPDSESNGNDRRIDVAREPLIVAGLDENLHRRQRPGQSDAASHVERA